MTWPVIQKGIESHPRSHKLRISAQIYLRKRYENIAHQCAYTSENGTKTDCTSLKTTVKVQDHHPKQR